MNNLIRTLILFCWGGLLNEIKNKLCKIQHVSWFWSALENWLLSFFFFFSFFKKRTEVPNYPNAIFSVRESGLALMKVLMLQSNWNRGFEEPIICLNKPNAHNQSLSFSARQLLVWIQAVYLCNERVQLWAQPLIQCSVNRNLALSLSRVSLSMWPSSSVNQKPQQILKVDHETFCWLLVLGVLFPVYKGS